MADASARHGDGNVYVASKLFTGTCSRCGKPEAQHQEAERYCFDASPPDHLIEGCGDIESCPKHGATHDPNALVEKQYAADEQLAADLVEVSDGLVPLLFANGDPARVKCDKCHWEEYVIPKFMQHPPNAAHLFVSDFKMPKGWTKIIVIDDENNQKLLFVCPNCTVSVE